MTQHTRKQGTISRRRAIASLAGGVAAACTPSSPGLEIIDVHVHANFDDEVLRRQASNLSRVDFSPAGLLAEMDESYVVQALSIGFETEQSELSHQAGNPMSSAFSGELARRISPVGGINPDHLDTGGLARVERALAAKRLKGLKIYLGYYHIPPGADVYKPVYELAGKHGVPVIFHTGDTYSPNAKVRYAHPLPIDDVAVDYRNVTFVLAHLGNPWTMDAAEVLYKNPNVYADLSGFLVGDEGYFADPGNAEGIADAVERIRRAFSWVENPAKFMYGSDWPLVPMKPYIQFVKRAIDRPYQEQVFHSNARKVFKL